MVIPCADCVPGNFDWLPRAVTGMGSLDTPLGLPGGMARAEVGIGWGDPGTLHRECPGRSAEVGIDWGSL